MFTHTMASLRNEHSNDVIVTTSIQSSGVHEIQCDDLCIDEFMVEMTREKDVF